MAIPEFALDLILEYLRPLESLGIDERTDNIILRKIANAKATIRRAVYNWKMDHKIAMNVNYFQIPKIVFKRFYPLNMRKVFIECALDLLAEDFERSVTKFEFNDIIDILTEEELDTIGWN